MRESKKCGYSKCDVIFYRDEQPKGTNWEVKKYHSDRCCCMANREQWDQKTNEKRKAERAKAKERMQKIREAKRPKPEDLPLIRPDHPSPPMPEHLRSGIMARVLPPYLRGCVFEG